VPPKIQASDWDRLFAPNAPRRGGPLQVLTYTSIVLVFIAAVGALLAFGVRYRDKQIAEQIATATAIAPTIAALQTQTAQALIELDAERTAIALALTPTAEPSIGVGEVTQTGNLRTSAPSGDVIGLLAPGDKITFYQELLVGGDSWYRIRVSEGAAERPENAVAVGSEGWASAILLTAPQTP
jgi:hypothetical protein